MVEAANGRTKVDARFLLANERTLLAWVRTALALLAAAGAVFEFTDVSGRRPLSIALAVMGIATAAAGAGRFSLNDRAIRTGEEISGGHAPELLALGVSALGIALVIALLVAS